MTEPTKTKNLDDRYGFAALPWSRARDLLATQTPKENLSFFVGTVRPDGRPHSAPVGAIWVDGALYFKSGPGTRRARNLAANPACVVSVRLNGLDLTLEGEAQRVTDSATLERVAAVYREGGWPATVDGDSLTAPYSAPSAGAPPWSLYRLVLDRAIGVATAEPHGATRWDFSR
ncbi:pyridoxamine 5'-phosphate oxidase family protein [Amycolatopsis nalaikhensis]|uniref:Pyridoxamine 5'-phosphate oxidase family protein n=2 Tax=Amycolatopsis TaxID=1813 RepID=A0ABY8X8E0_9PSEU|nr:pyridoxamine 5'-phosphate oxidase family protein [Amycolatopsis sp. 2-2]WIV52674.1 pyridoxamine 5'-phosphate oxidase family protein [Amycolatopsis sp. 2-2]